MSTQTEEESVFAEGVNQTTETNQEVEAAKPDLSESAFANQLAEIRNERGEPKYKDLPTALEALKHSQEYIPSLKTEKESLEVELTKLREELAKRKTAEEFMERLNASNVKEQPSGEQPQPSGNSLTLEQVKQMLEQSVPDYLKQHEQQTRAQENLSAVDKALRESFGDQANQVVSKKAQELGISNDKLAELSRESPQAVLALFNVTPKNINKPNTSSVNLPPISKPSGYEVPKPERSVLRGATTKQQAEHMAAIRRKVYEKHGVTE